MPDGEEGMVVDHPRSGVTHDLADSFSHFRFVTMDGTIGADGFVLAEAAGFCPFLSIIKQLFAIGAEIIFSMVIPAVNFDHLMDGLSFSIDVLVHEIPLKNSANFCPFHSSRNCLTFVVTLKRVSRHGISVK